MMLNFLTLVCSLLVYAGAQDDETVKPGASGVAVVEAVIRRIQSSCIFSADNMLMRRVAYVESYDGAHPDAYPPEYHGGIWMVDEAMYEVTKSGNFLSYMAQELAAVKQSLSIDWAQTSWQDLRMPLYSGLGARLYIAYQSTKSDIPYEISDQANFWKANYRSDGDVDKFIEESGRLEKGCSTAKGADIMFVLDGSGSIRNDRFYEDIIPFVEEFIKGFDIGVDTASARVGVIQYSTNSEMEFTMDEYTNAADMITALGKIVYQGGSTYTADALHMMIYEGFASPRKDHPKVGIVLTDGAGSNKAEVIEKALEAHAADITVFAIGVGNYNLEELEAIASDPDCEHQFLLDNFDDLGPIKDVIERKTCDAPVVIRPDEDEDVEEIIPPGEDINCKVNLPVEGVTIKVYANTGEAHFYLASDTYPSAAYYQYKVDSLPGESGVIHMDHDGEHDTMYCNIAGGETIKNNITIGVDPGDTDWCTKTPCLNGGSCFDTGDSVKCNCAKNYFGDHCEDYGYNCGARNPCLDPDNIGGYFAHENVYNFLFCGAGLTCNVKECPPDTIWDDEWKACQKENLV